MKKSLSIKGVLAAVLIGFFTGCSDDEKGEDNRFSFVVNAVDAGSSMDCKGLALQFGTADKAVAMAEATIDKDGLATFNVDISKYADQTVWFCIPNVVKYFHQLTPVEIEKQMLSLPDKDKGSTLRTTTQIGGKYTENDWIVALYMGVNKDGNTSTPIYWATGNLIATKINAANAGPSAVSYHIATFEETCREADAKGVAYVGGDERLVNETADAYMALDAGEQWDFYCFGDASGTMLFKNVEKLVEVAKQKQGDSYIFNVSGSKNWDIATAHLGTLWRTPTGGKDAHNEFAAFEDNSEGYEGLQPDGVVWKENDVKLGYKYDYTIEHNGKVITTNTLYIPAAGYRHDAMTVGARGIAGFYWSATADPTCTIPYVPNGEYKGEVKEYTTAFNYGFLKGEILWFPHPRTSGQAIRPVCE